jgi:hypothetical protein
VVFVTEPSDAGATWRDTDELRRVEARLIARFSPPLRPEEVERLLLDSVARFDGARVTAFLPVLIERAAVDRLQAAIDTRQQPVSAEGV